ncbi:MAG TPA: GNAT family protein [Tepidisphaeraceae bacterium]|nr:GNAT family protein [Tepidisphaeraceae bacterium]
MPDDQTAAGEIEVRTAVPDDAEGMLACFREILVEPGIGVMTEPDEFTYTTDDERKLIAGLAADRNGTFVVAIAGGRVVGTLSCLGEKRRARRHVASIGISIRREFRGHGVGTRMMRAAIDWARQSDVIRRLELSVFAENSAAIRVYENVGFAVEGRRPRAAFREGRFIDDLIMGMWVG